MSWRDQLRPASYRGVRFGVLGGSIRFGRRNAVHEYPYRDTVWVEDMGRAARRIQMTGFLVGDDVIAQRERLIAACESPGDGILVHPTLGRLTVSLMDTETTERWDHGRVFEINFTFIEAGQRVFPAAQASTSDAVSDAAAAADAAASGDFLTRATSALQHGAVVVNAAVNTADAWARQARVLANDATNIYHAVSSLPGTFGRYFGGRRNGFGDFTRAVQAQGQSVQQLIGLGAASRANVNTAAGALTTIAGGLGQ